MYVLACVRTDVRLHPCMYVCTHARMYVPTCVCCLFLCEFLRVHFAASSVDLPRCLFQRQIFAPLSIVTGENLIFYIPELT